ncbi:MAG TPA: NUDIX hydrolase [Candidatus Saccharimonadales bacterium]|nr:NUDIX hydrolase [Candidatus Saccharimonadales bacterium]
MKDSDGKILLMHRNTPKRVQWEIPGGIVEDGEKPAEAAAREVKEELDLDVTVTREIGDKHFEEDGEQHAYFWFEATIQAGEPRLTGSDNGIHDDIRYFSLTEMQAMFEQLSANTKNFVQAVQNGEVLL